MTTELPSRWSSATVGEVSTLVRGVTFKKSDVSSEPGTGLVPIVRAGNVQDGRIRVDEGLVYVPADRVAPEQYLCSGDTVIATSSGSLSVVGKSAPVRKDWMGAHGAFMAVLRPHAGVQPAYLSYFLQSDPVRKLWRNAAAGTNINNLKKNDLLSTEVHVPPLPEQERIVTAIEEHFSRLDAVEASIAAAETKCPALSSIAMSQLFSPEWPSRRLDAVAQVGSGATPKRSESKYWSQGTIPWVTSGAVNQLSIWSAEELISERALAETSVKLWPAGTVLMAMYGEGKTRGKAAILEFESTCNQACAAINCDQSRLDGRFLRTFLNVQYEVNRRLSSGGVQPNLNLGLIKAMEIPVPSLEIQSSVAIQAEEIVSATVEMLDACMTARGRVSALRRSILAEAFSGQLVPQSLEDEPSVVPSVDS